jgi:hypothetical protein
VRKYTKKIIVHWDGNAAPQSDALLAEFFERATSAGRVTPIPLICGHRGVDVRPELSETTVLEA